MQSSPEFFLEIYSIYLKSLPVFIFIDAAEFWRISSNTSID